MAGASSSSGGMEALPPSKFGKYITVLSIDGGGMRGLIPLQILKFLEEELKAIAKEKRKQQEEELQVIAQDKKEEAAEVQKIDDEDKQVPDPDVRISDYFDVIAGTSTGGLIATMLAVPENKEDTIKRPKYTIDQITGFYERLGPEIFKSGRDIACWIWNPKYDSKALHQVIRREMDDLMLSDTVTSIVVPTFDVSLLAPVIFSSFKNDPRSLINQQLSDVCIATTAAPTFFQPHPVDGRPTGKDRQPHKLHLVDGGVVANNPTLVAIAAIENQIAHENSDFVPVVANNPNMAATQDEEDDVAKCYYDKIDFQDGTDSHISPDINPGVSKRRVPSEGFKRYLILSIGTQHKRGTGEYSVKKIKKKGKIMWAKPAIDMLSCASEFLVNFNVAIFFQSQGDPDNYLRIQATDGMFGDCYKKLPMDAASPKDIEELKSIGTILLEEKQGRTDKITGRFESTNEKLKNHEALRAFAKKLSEERDYRIREQKKYNAKKPHQEHDNHIQKQKEDFAKKHTIRHEGII
ncbi:unnamed protein product [Urochloa decumbens]|uniref:Patatin n=1 Tax=Urochloa decumbens TaxID=240449 RepID=A0ABC9AIG5_9POAL